VKIPFDAELWWEEGRDFMTMGTSFDGPKLWLLGAVALSWFLWIAAVTVWRGKTDHGCPMIMISPESCTITSSRFLQAVFKKKKKQNHTSHCYCMSQLEAVRLLKTPGSPSGDDFGQHLSDYTVKRVDTAQHSTFIYGHCIGFGLCPISSF
jgi:hypothetical protein